MVDQVQIDVVGSDPFQRAGGGALDVVVAQVPRRDFRDEEQPRAIMSLDRAADQPLGVSGRVALGRVDVGDPALDRHFDCGEIPLVAALAHRPGSQAEDGRAKPLSSFFTGIPSSNLGVDPALRLL